MRFSENGLYVEKYIKCANCGLLVYGAGIAGSRTGKPCSSAPTGAWNGRR